MIYLENNNGTQQIFIPKNLNISINKTYDEGFQDGMNYQKEKLEDLNVTENGVYKSDNGYKQVNVEVANENICKLEELNITIINDIEEYTATDSNLDGFSKVNVDASEFGNKKYEEGYNQGKSEGGESNDFSSEQVENKYSHLAFITKNIYETQIVVDKTKLTDRFGNYIQNGSINIAQFKNGICLAMDEKYLNPDSNGGCVVRKIEDGAIDWNAVDIFRSYTILEFGENMTRDKSSNLLNLFIYASTSRNETVTFNDGCFATSNRLDKIVFEEPFNVIVKGNPFEGINSWGQFIVKGEESNRSKYTDLINLLPTDWEVIFNPDYSE